MDRDVNKKISREIFVQNEKNFRRYVQKHPFTGVGVNCNYRTLIRCTSDDYWTV